MPVLPCFRHLPMVIVIKLVFLFAVQHVLTMRATGMLHFGFAVWTLNKQQVAFGIGAIRNVVALISTVKTLRQDVICDGLAPSAVKSKVFALEQRGNAVFYVMAIGSDTAFQLTCDVNTCGLFSSTLWGIHTMLTCW